MPEHTFSPADGRPLRIGFDAKWFFSGNPSGRVIVRNILDQWLTRPGPHEFYIFLKKEDRFKDFPYQGPHIHPVYVWGRINLLSNLLAVPLKARSLKLDAVIFQYFSPLFSHFKRIVFINDAIYRSHPEYFTLMERLYFSPIRFLARRAHRVCTISESEKGRLVRHKFSPEERIDVVHLGVDKRFKPQPAHDSIALAGVISTYRLPEKFLLYVGRLNARKNLPNLLKALALLKDRSMPLVLAGAYDWKMFDLGPLIGELGIGHRVIYTGFVEDRHLPALYSLAGIFCYVSFDEGFGLPPLEAMASGVPVVVANSGSLPETCGNAGNYVDPFDPADIARAIDLLLADRDLYEKQRNIGLDRAARFTWEQSAANLLSVCRETVPLPV